MATAHKPLLQLQEQLFFRPKWWWDPVPDWVLDQISTVGIRELALVQMEAQRAVLEVQMKSLDKSISIMNKMK